MVVNLMVSAAHETSVFTARESIDPKIGPLATMTISFVSVPCDRRVGDPSSESGPSCTPTTHFRTTIERIPKAEQTLGTWIDVSSVPGLGMRNSSDRRAEVV